MTINRVTGLRPMGDRPRAGRRNSARVDSPSASDIRMPGLRPTARPVDTYSRPQAPSQDNSFLQLARALGEINPVIGGFLNDEAARERKDAEDRAMRRIGGMSYDEARAAVDSGMPEMANPWFKAAFMKVMGERTAYNRMNELSAQYATDPNRHEIDFSSYVRNAANEDLTAFDDKHFEAGYLPLMGNYEATGAAKHTEVQSARTMDEARANVFGVFLGQAQTLSAEGKHPEEIAKELYARYEGQEEFLRLSRGEQDELMINVISALANDGDWELVNALLSHQREDDFGNMSSLATSPQYSVKTAGIIERAKSAHGEQVLEQSIGSYADLNIQAGNGNLTKEQMDQYVAEHPNMLDGRAQADLLIRSENARQRAQANIAEANQKAAMALHAEQVRAVVHSSNLSRVQTGESGFIQDIEVPNANGEGTETLTAKQQQDQLGKDLAAYVKEQGEATNADPEAILDLEVKLFATAGVANPRWAQVFATGVSQATPSNLKQFLESGEVVLPPALEAGIGVFEQLYMKSPLLLNTYFSSADDRRFFDLVVQGKKLGMDNYQAVRQANQALMNGPASHPMVNMTTKQAEEALGRVKVGGFLGWGAHEPMNASQALSEISDTMRYYAAVGGQVGNAAFEAAVEQYASTHININGYMVSVAGIGVGDPGQFSMAVDLALSEVMANQPRYLNGQQLHLEDITIRPTGNGVFRHANLTPYRG
ncbi:hypothetical protein O9Z70_08145 [Devosia sp. YIM 151766]|uniref:hypothetical protein n=1 Tax=Devosia sp. YIM 151766 TaxID=3017325 RepID=UPI00255C6A03|nr:hypothetical protein [Devosia sp. YIM 151766]WIY51465.1 hypothetical protein O9Z70_08145 [Devosia sp. YIM 151766]